MANRRFAALGASVLALALSIASNGCFSSAVYYRLAVKPDMGKQEVVPFAGNENVTVIRTVGPKAIDGPFMLQRQGITFLPIPSRAPPSASLRRNGSGA